MSENNGVRHPALSRVVDTAFDAIEDLRSGAAERDELLAISKALSRDISEVAEQLKPRPPRRQPRGTRRKTAAARLPEPAAGGAAPLTEG